MKIREGAVRLLKAEDLGKGKSNAFGDPLVGWKSTSLGEGGLYNPRAFAMLRVVVRKLVEGELADLYDQPMLVENLGSIVVAQTGKKVGLVQIYRMVGERIMQAEPNYVARLDQEGRWDELFDSLGAWRWEVPRGIPLTKVVNADQLTSDYELALAAAKLEAFEEAGYTLQDVRIVGRVNTNPTFFAHAQWVAHGTVVKAGANQPEDLEIIGKARFFMISELHDLAARGEFDDGLTMSALWLAGLC